MNRLDGLSEEALQTTLLGLRQDLDELKSRQPPTSSDLLFNLTKESGAWDVNGVFVAGFAVKQYRVTFTPDIATKPYAELTYDYQVTGGTGFEDLQVIPDPANATSDTFRSWLFNFANDFNDVDLYLKFAVKAADAGTITWSEV